MPFTIQYRSGGTELIDATEPLWDQQKAYHLEIDSIHPESFARIEFETRMQQIRDKAIEFLVVLAEDRETEQVIGYCLATINRTQVGEVDSVFVEEHYRRQGVGREFVRITLDWMEANKAYKTKIHVLEANQEAHSLYRSFGFEVRQLELIRKNNKH